MDSIMVERLALENPRVAKADIESGAADEQTVRWFDSQFKDGQYLRDEAAVWSGAEEVPLIGEVVKVTMNGLGVGQVRSYFVAPGASGGQKYLGLEVSLFNPPAWWVKTHGAGQNTRVFGTEVRRFEGKTPGMRATAALMHMMLEALTVPGLPAGEWKVEAGSYPGRALARFTAPVQIAPDRVQKLEVAVLTLKAWAMGGTTRWMRPGADCRYTMNYGKRGKMLLKDGKVRAASLRRDLLAAVEEAKSNVIRREARMAENDSREEFARKLALALQSEHRDGNYFPILGNFAQVAVGYSRDESGARTVSVHFSREIKANTPEAAAELIVKLLEGVALKVRAIGNVS